jgi:hypothetical protein
VNSLYYKGYLNYILTLSDFFLYWQRRPEACIILQQCTRRSYYLPVYFQFEGAILFEKSDKKKQFFCRILLWKLSRIKENGITKKMNSSTTIFYSVVNAVQTFKVLFMWRHNVAPNSTRKVRDFNVAKELSFTFISLLKNCISLGKL